VKWRKRCQEQGIIPLLTHGRNCGFKKSIVTKEEHKKIEKKLYAPNNGIRGYVELLDCLTTEFNKEIKYITLLKMCRTSFRQ